jgi:hypothetical protein
VWGNQLESDPRPLLSEVEDSEPAHDRAEEWLSERLAAEPVLATELDLRTENCRKAPKGANRASSRAQEPARQPGANCPLP